MTGDESNIDTNKCIRAILDEYYRGRKFWFGKERTNK